MITPEDTAIRLRRAKADDIDAIWPIFHEVVAAQESYAFDPATDKAGARYLWLELPQETWIAEDEDGVLGTYYLRPNLAGPGSHVCNCGYMTAASARGRGIATAMCVHSQQRARELGYLAMQFNCVVSSNEGAARLWQKLGYDIVGRLPRAFRHARLGLVDALVMYKWLGDDQAS